MFATVHISVALWLTTKITNPLLGFILGVVSHFILDIIPHGDEGLFDKANDNKFIFFLKVALVDVILASFLVLYYVYLNPSVDKMLLTATILGAWLPDLAWIGIETFNIKFLYWYCKFHERMHKLINWNYSIIYGVPLQIVVTLIVIKAIF